MVEMILNQTGAIQPIARPTRTPSAAVWVLTG
jgi:hypothetical protein